MNRIKLGPLAALDASKPVNNTDITPEDSSNHIFSCETFDLNNDFSFLEAQAEWVNGEANAQSPGPVTSTFMPVNYQSTHAYPLVVWLHSHNADHHQLNEVMPQISERNYVGAAVAGLERGDCSQPGWLQDSRSIEVATNHVSYLIQSVAERFNINTNRIFIAGQGSGGTMAFRIAFEHPEWFAGIASINGSLPSNLNPLSNWRTCRNLPVYWSHGRSSVEFPESNLCHQLRLLHVAGFDVTLRQYPCDDQLPSQTYHDLDRWMMEQIAVSGANIIS